MSQTASTDYFTGIRDSLTDLILDYGRAKVVDVETRDSDKNIPDYVDVYNGQAGTGIGVGTVLLIGAALVIGIVVLKKVL